MDKALCSRLFGALLMKLDAPQLLGLFVITCFMLGLYWAILHKQPRQIWLFALALLVLGLGYLATTPAPTEIARIIFGQQY